MSAPLYSFVSPLYLRLLVMKYSSLVSSPALGFAPRFSSASLDYCPECSVCPDRSFCCGCAECLNS